MAKYYVVWEGVEPGVYDNWQDASEQVKGYPNAKFKGFKSREEAIAAFRGTPEDHIGLIRSIAEHGEPMPTHRDYSTIPEINLKSICVDAACSHNPGPVEYRGVLTVDGREMFHVGPLEEGTNNLGEFLGLVHALAWLDAKGRYDVTIYTDSRTAMAWVRNATVRTTIKPTENNQKIRLLVERALTWLHTHQIKNPILKWNTEQWGEIPADFGRK